MNPAPLDEKAESLTDWRRWVPEEVRKEVLMFMLKAFLIGGVIAALAGSLYWKYSTSKEKPFQGIIIVAALAFTMPAFATSLKLMLSMFYMSWAGMEKSEGVFKHLKEIKDEAKPVIENAAKIMDNLACVIERYGKSDLVEEVKTLLSKEGGIIQKVERLTVAIEALATPAPLPRKAGLLERGIGKIPSLPAVGAAGDPEEPSPDAETRVLHAGHAT